MPLLFSRLKSTIKIFAKSVSPLLYSDKTGKTFNTMLAVLQLVDC
nr:uncharacterized protein CTRU02_05738 [Colletotrichum truncatum]KAF6793483.1 hypothetical protein CTRU02_05738 [Colletotrichum truncatum]